MQRVMVLGATGSIGLSTLDVIGRHPDKYRAQVLAANRSVDQMEALCLEHRPAHAVMFSDDAATELEIRLKGRVETIVHAGDQPMVDLRRATRLIR